MKTYKTYLFSAMALGVIGASFIVTEALADHRDGRGRGYGRQVVDVYIDAHHDPLLERAISEHLQATNPYVNIVISPRTADVTVTVEGYLSHPEVYDRPGHHARGAYAVMAYDYQLLVRAGGRTIYRDRAYGEVTRPFDRRGGYHNGTYNNSGSKFEKAERAIQVFGVFLGTVTGKSTGTNYGRDNYGQEYVKRDGNLERALRLEAYDRIAQSFGHIKIPKRYASAQGYRR